MPTIAIIAAVLACEGFLLHAAGRGVSKLLLFVMTIWVLAPFAALGLGRSALVRWAGAKPGALDVLILAVTTVSVAVYAVDAVTPLNQKAAFVYVVVPLSSWVLIAVALLLMRSSNRSRRPSG